MPSWSRDHWYLTLALPTSFHLFGADIIAVETRALRSPRYSGLRHCFQVVMSSTWEMQYGSMIPSFPSERRTPLSDQQNFIPSFRA
eukprot:5898700-Pyramimonas_sp.AAC.1